MRTNLKHDSLLQDLQSEARAHPALSSFDERTAFISINRVVIVEVMDHSLQDLLFLEVIIQKNELSLAPHWPHVRLRWIQAGTGSFGSSLVQF